MVGTLARIGAVFLAPMACSPPTPTSDTPAPAVRDVAQNASGGSANAPVTPLRQPSSGLTTRAIESAFASWLDSQNRADFPRYEGLYANRFFGIKRAGERTYRFDREGWMRDRKRMFRPEVQVVADNVEIRAQGATYIVIFDQTWSSRRFEDKGRKSLIWVADARGNAKIGREEMLDSTLRRDPANSRDQQTGQLYLPARNVGPTTVHLLLDGTDLRTSPKPPRLLDTEGPMLAYKPVAHPPKAYATWRGSRVRLHDLNGNSSGGVIREFRAISGYYPHFGQFQDWEERSATDTARARDLWTESDAHLVAVVHVESPHFEAAWASHGPVRKPRVLRRTPANAQLRDRALMAARQTKAYRAIEREYEDYYPKSSPGHAEHWEDHDGAKPEVDRFGEGHEAVFVSVSMAAGAGCGDFEGHLLAMFRLTNASTDSPELEPIEFKNYDFHERPHAAVDLDGDGQFEWITQVPPDGQRLWRPSQNGLELVQRYEFRDHDCPC